MRISWLFAAALLSTGCHTMAPITLAELGGIRPSQVWVTRGDQSVVVVTGPQLFGDTLVGYVNGTFEEMPTAGLKQVLVKRRARGKTVALIAAGTVGLAAATLALTGKSDYKDPRPGYCDETPERPECQ